MNLNQLETLIAISKTMSFRKAGEMLNLTQPAVSAQIKSLEEEFRTVLVDRNQPVTLTDSGQVVSGTCRTDPAIVEELKQKLADLDEMPQGHIRARNDDFHRDPDLAAHASYFQNQYPLIKITIHSMPSSLIREQRRERHRRYRHRLPVCKATRGLESSVLYYDSFELVVSPGSSAGRIRPM